MQGVDFRPAVSATQTRRWSFARCALDERSLQLTRDGFPVEIEPKPLEMLRHLLEHAGEVVGKDELMRAVWGDRIISEASLTKCVARLRDAIGDHDQSVIRTQYGYGYRFASRVSVESIAHSPQAGVEPAPVGLNGAVREAERRQLTVLFCDLVDSTRLSEALDPEHFRELLIVYQRVASQVVERFEGRVAQVQGDGLVIYFGHPIARDDDAERAVRCACELNPAVARIEHDPRLAASVGVHTGTVVVGDTDGSANLLAAGLTTNLAARLRTHAQPGTVLLSEDTFRLVRDLFVTLDLGPLELRGFSQPVHAYQALRPSGARSRLEVAASLTPFVGREQERALLADRWRSACAGEGQAVLLSAEPGLGKSRLLMVFHDGIAGHTHAWLECRASPLARNNAHAPIVELLERGLSIRTDDSPDRKLRSLEQGLDTAGIEKSDAIPLLAPLFNLPPCATYPASTLGAARRRKRMLEILVRWILSHATLRPLVIVFEDLHWADASSIEVLGLLLEQLATSRVLLLMSARPEFTVPWPVPSRVTVTVLRALLPSQAAGMLDHFTGDQGWPPPLTKLVLERAGGVPLFVEELAKALIESGQLVEREGRLALCDPLARVEVPGTLQASLMSRLDRLGPARELAQVAAVIGREVPHGLLQLVAGLDEAHLDEQLRALVHAELLHARGKGLDTFYVFKHALIQDIAYDSLLRSTRQRLHGAVATALESRFPLRAQHEPAVLAAHFEKANQAELAAGYFKAAAEKAVAAVSLQEAVAHCEHALMLLGRQPEADARNLLELDLSLTLGNCQAAMLGYQHANVARTLARARELSEVTREPALRARALSNFCVVEWNLGQLPLSRASADHLVALGREMQDEAIQWAGLMLRSWVLLALGDLKGCLDDNRQAQSLLTPEAAAGFRMFGRDPYTLTAVPQALAQWLLGYPDQALETTQRLMSGVQSTNDPTAIGWATFGYALTRLSRREPEQVLEPGKRAVELSEAAGNVELLPWSQHNLGLAYCQLGRFDLALPLSQAAGLEHRGRGLEVMRSMYAAIEAAQSWRFGRFEETQALLHDAFAYVARSGERFWEAELHRVQGELLLSESGAQRDAAETCFHRALEISRQQGARALELRAATSLARLWQREARVAEARALLVPVYASFREGLDTPDMIEAAAQLAGLR